MSRVSSPPVSSGSEPMAVGVEQDVGALERHDARALREPLVPADAHADRPDPRAPGLEARVAGVEVELLLVAGSVGDVALPVHAQHRAVGVDHRQAVEVGLARLLEERDGQHDAELAGQAREARDERVLVDRVREREQLLALELGEVEVLEQLLEQHQLRAVRRCLAHERLGLAQVLLQDVRAAHLHDADAERARALGHASPPSDAGATSPAGCCCVTQWNAPPPVISSLAGSPITSRPGKSGRSTSSARSSLSSP